MAKSADLVIDVRGAAEVGGQLDGFAERVVTATRALTPQIVDVFRRDESRRFSNEGPGWPELSEDTIRQKAARGDSRPEAILRASGALYASLTGNPTGLARASGIRLGTPIWYAIFAQAGTVNAPRREVVGLTEQNAQTIGDLILDYILAAGP